MPERLMSLKDFADYLGISRGRAAALVRSGRVRGAERVGANWVIRVPEHGKPEVLASRRGPKPRWANLVVWLTDDDLAMEEAQEIIADLLSAIKE